MAVPKTKDRGVYQKVNLLKQDYERRIQQLEDSGNVQPNAIMKSITNSMEKVKEGRENYYFTLQQNFLYKGDLKVEHNTTHIKSIDNKGIIITGEVKGNVS